MKSHLHFSYSLIVAVVILIVHSSHQPVTSEDDLNNFNSNVLRKLDEIKESSAAFRKELSDSIEQLKQEQLRIEQALNQNTQILGLLIDSSSSASSSSSKLNFGEQLMAAVRSGDITQVKRLLELGAPIEYQDSVSNRPIHVAVMNRHPQILQVLLEHKADIDSQGQHLQTALVKTGAPNCVECARILLDKRADMNIRDAAWNTAIIHPARAGHIELVELLLSKGANINDAQVEGLTGLHWAARDGQLPIVQYLVQKGANVRLRNAAGQTPLDEAITNNHPLVADYLGSTMKSN